MRAPDDLDAFRRLVWSFYREHGRVLPWRETSDPYRVLVAEVMLQQTQVPRVLAKYPAFVSRFPTVRALAEAPLGEVLRVWRGLGYNRRAAFLHRSARGIVDSHGGRVPDTLDELRALPGLGPATAAQVLAFAYNRPVVFVETNIRAVFIHHFFPREERVRDRDILPLVDATLDRGNPREWYYALFDYGSFLKKVAGNPARRSAHHARQAPFEGSDRQLRGRIVAALLDRGPLAVASLFRDLGEERARVERVLGGLVADGLVSFDGRMVAIAEQVD